MNATPHHLPARLLALLLAAPGAVQAAREYGAHEHGRGVLEVAQQRQDLHVTLRVPAVNVVGFEHQASTDAQRNAIERTLDTFRRAQDLIVPSAAANCTLERADVTLGGHTGEHAEHAHKHEKKHEHGADHGHGKAESDDEVHSELHVQWRFHCAAPQALRGLEVKVFEHLLEVDEIDAQVVTDTLQKAAELRPGNPALDLSTR